MFFRSIAFSAALAPLALASGPLAAAHQTSGPQETATRLSQGGLSLTLPDSVARADLGERDLRVIAVQTMLDRSRHSPGVIDGYMGGNTRRAIRYYRMANGLPAGDAIDETLIRSLVETQGGGTFRSYTITPSDVEGPFYKVPSGMAGMAEMEWVGFQSPLEMLAERFHMGREFLVALNPGVDFSRAGSSIVIASHGDDEISGKVDRIEVRRAHKSVVALDARGTMLASYPATIGSDQFPSPSGRMAVDVVAPEANYTFDPSGREWGPDRMLVIPPGPNNPVGGIWIGLTKEGYGIHGSPDPHLIGKTASHGCVRLTNWDAQELARAVSAGVTVEFV